MYVHMMAVPTWGRYVVVLLLFLVGGVTYAQTMGGGNASISLSPSSGPPGTTVNVSVNGANWDFIDGGCAANGNTFYTVPDVFGNSFSAAYTVPGNASGTINISCNVSLFMSGGEVQDQQTVSAGFTVTGGQQDDGGGQQPPPPDDPPPPPDNAGDADRDGVPDDADRCPFVSGRGDQFGGVSGADGCPVDSDGDGFNDGVDACPFDPSTTSGPCNQATPVPTAPSATAPPQVQLAVLPADGQCYVATRTRTGVNLRAEPSTTASVAGVLDPELAYEVDSVTVNTQDERWYQLNTPLGETGFVRSDVVRTTDPCAALQAAGSPAFLTASNPNGDWLATGTRAGTGCQGATTWGDTAPDDFLVLLSFQTDGIEWDQGDDQQYQFTTTDQEHTFGYNDEHSARLTFDSPDTATLQRFAADCSSAYEWQLAHIEE